MSTLNPPQSEDPILAELLEREEVLLEEARRLDREREQEATEWATASERAR